MAVLVPLGSDAFVDRLQADPGPFALIAKAVDQVAAIEGGPKVSPAAFVLEPNYRAVGRPNAGGGRIDQDLQWLVPVLTCVLHYGDATGAKASAEAVKVRSHIWTRLVGWLPNPNGFAVQADTGRMIGFKNSFFYFLDTFRLPARLTNDEDYNHGYCQAHPDP